MTGISHCNTARLFGLRSTGLCHISRWRIVVDCGRIVIIPAGVIVVSAPVFAVVILSPFFFFSHFVLIAVSVLPDLLALFGLTFVILKWIVSKLEIAFAWGIVWKSWDAFFDFGPFREYPETSSYKWGRSPAIPLNDTWFSERSLPQINFIPPVFCNLNPLSARSPRWCSPTSCWKSRSRST